MGEEMRAALRDGALGASTLHSWRQSAHVFGVFLKLGLTSFGGPIAHLGYFRREFVDRRRWIDEGGFAQLMAICQFLPGPASSQMGFSLGLMRAGWSGALAAFLGFTLPSALLLLGFAAFAPRISGATGEAAIHGLKLVALVVVADGVIGMARRLCPDLPRLAVALMAGALVLTFDHAWMQVLVVALGGVAGWTICRSAAPGGSGELRVGYGPATGWLFITAFTVLLVGLPFAADAYGGLVALAEAFYRSGALVFGGGHVVLPLLEDAVVGPGWLAPGDFLAAYGAAQAVPGPMFALAACLGAQVPDGGLAGAAVALGAIFLPGLLLVAGVLPLWGAIVSRPGAARVLAGINAAVVGLLAAALYDPVWKSAVRGPSDLVIAGLGFLLLAVWRRPPLLIVAWCVAASVVGAIAL